MLSAATKIPTLGGDGRGEVAGSGDGRGPSCEDGVAGVAVEALQESVSLGADHPDDRVGATVGGGDDG